MSPAHRPRRLRAAALVVVMTCLAGCDGAQSAAAGKQGLADAERDLAAGTLKLREPPLPSPAWWGEYHRLLRDRCGVQVDVVDRTGQGGKSLTDDDEAYNRAMTAEIERQHGAGIVGRLREEARAGHEARAKNGT